MSAFQLDTQASKLELWTYKEGLLSGVAHDLCFRAETLQLELEVSGEDLEVQVVVPVAGLRLRGQVQHGSVKPMKPKDAADIQKNLLGDRVLGADQHPELRFAGRGTPGPEGLDLEGALSLRGVTRPLPLHTSWSTTEDGRVQAEGEVRFLQSVWGIKPFSAMLGSLRVRDELRVSWSLVFTPV